uniref:Uncharacterized protein n=1 Tax=Colobus angolensis palliatus TaxID=336983 RepID=A0A2K5K3N1_COLAP
MDSDFSHAFQKELICVICSNYLVDPVTVCCGHSFCRPCLCLSWEEAQSPANCPACSEPSQKQDFKTNILLKNLVTIARKASLWQFLSSEKQICGTHRETKKMFCDVEKSLLCLLCSNSQEHRTHKHYPIEGAAEEHREKLLKQMRILWKKIQENQRNLNEERRTAFLWRGDVVLRAQMIRNEYRKLHPVLHREEKQHLERLNKEYQEIFQQLQRSWVKMDQKSKHLKEMYQELMKMCHKPDVKLYRKLNQLNQLPCRSASVLLHMPQPVNPELTARPITGLVDRLNRFRGECRPLGGINMQCLQLWFSMGSFTSKPLGRVGVFLDFESGSVSFLNVTRSSLIWSYPAGSLNFPVRPFFHTGHR